MKSPEQLKFRQPKEFENIKEIIYNSAKVYGNQTAYVIKNKGEGDVNYTNISYAKLLEDINALGTALYSLGFNGKRIAIIGKNRYEWILAHLANVMGGIVSIPLDKDLQIDELENSLIRSKAEAIFYDDKLADFMNEIKQREHTNVKEFFCMTGDIADLIKKGNELVEGGDRSYIDYKVNSNEMSVLLFTSGTTEKSKAVMLSQKNIASNVYALQCVEDIQSTDTNMAFLPFHHIFGSTCIILMMACGVKTAFPDGLRYIKQNMKEYKVSLFIGVPVLTETMYKAIVKEVEKQGKTKMVKIATVVSNFLLKLHIDVRRKLFKQILDGLGGELRLVITGGAASDPATLKGFNDIGVITLQGYGLSETSPVIAAECKKARKIGTVGYSMINDTLEIVNKDESGIGEIRVKGPNIMLGYYEMPELTNECIRDGWFYTGDLGYFDKDGMLVLTGRSKNLIVLKNGKKVFPEEVEMVVNNLDLVSECIVYGEPNPNEANDVTLAVKIVYDEDTIKEKYSNLSEGELKLTVWNKIKELNKTFPKYKHIKKLIVSHEELIKTTTKKVKRNEEINKILSTNTN